MKKFQLPIIGLITIIAAGGCNKVEPELTTSESKTIVSTLAGSGGFGYADGTGESAAFRTVFSIAVDGAGNVYASERDNNTIRKITPAGVVSTLAGAAGINGYADGTGSAARFSNLRGITVDPAGNVYVADGNNTCIRKITPSGMVTTFAGTPGSGGSADGPLNTGQITTDVEDLACDAAGNIYFGDFNTNRVRKITPTGVISTIAGTGSAGTTNGPVATATFRNLRGIAVDAAGNIYVVQDIGLIRKITPGASGVVTTLAGSTNGFVDGSAGQFNQPRGLGIDAAGNLYVADAQNKRIRKVTPAGFVSTIAGTGVDGFLDGPAANSIYSVPNDVAVDAAGKIYTSETQGRIRKIEVITTVHKPSNTWNDPSSWGNTP